MEKIGDMTELIEYFRYLNNFNWGNGLYQWYFYIGILMVLFFEKEKTAKIIFGWLPIVFLASIYNPLFNKLIRFVFPNPDPYYVRMFSFIPVIYGIGVGFMQVLGKLRGFVKASLLIALSIFIALTGNDIYHALDMKASENLEKVPDSVFNVVEAIRRKEQDTICVAVPSPLNISIRQVDAKIITPYGRDDAITDRLMRELGKSIPDVKSTMEMAGKRSVNYIVVHRNNECREAFRAEGYEPSAETAEYMIYTVEKVPQVVRKLDNKGRILFQTEVDESGKPRRNYKGFVTIAYEYDSQGYVNKEIYLDENGNRYMLPEGYSAVQRKTRFPSGLIESEIFLDAFDNPILINGRYETRYTYNGEKRVETESYYDAYGEPMNRIDVLFGEKRIFYNERGQIVQEKYYNVLGESVNSSDGYASIVKEYDSEYRLVKESYFDTTGQLVRNKAGYAGFIRKYDINGNMISEGYLDEKGDYLVQESGYAELRWEYDIFNRVILESYWNKDGTPFTLIEGYHALAKEYDEKGNISAETFLDVNGEETSIPAGCTRIERKYTELRKVKEERFFSYGKLYQIADGYSIRRREFDVKGNIILESYYNADEDLVCRSAGYASLKRTFDLQGHLICESYYDENGDPVNCVFGYASFTREVDSRGWILKESYFDNHGEPVCNTAGFSSVIREYNTFGSVVREVYLDETGNKIANKDGYDEIKREYNDANEMSSETFYLDSKPVE